MGPQPGRKRQASQHHCANSPSRTGWAHPQPPPGQAGGLSSCSPWMCEAKGLERGLEQKGEGKGGAVSLSPTPPLLQRQPLSLSQRKGILPSKKVPPGYEEKRPLAWESQAISPAGSGPVHFNSCTFMEDHKKGPSPARGLGWGRWAWGGRLRWGRPGEANPESCSQQPLWVRPHCL